MFDATMLLKQNAHDTVRAGGPARLYRIAVWLHLKYVVPLVSEPGDRVFVIAGSLQVTGGGEAIHRAVEDVCQRVRFDRCVVPCIWQASSSWGVQAADYALWTVQRRAAGKSMPSYCDMIESQIRSVFYPWG